MVDPEQAVNRLHGGPRLTGSSGPSVDGVRNFEDQAADIVESTLAHEESRGLGRRRRRDAQDGSGIRVDFTYDQAVPPVALEVTTLQDDSFLSAGSAAQKLADRLSDVAKEEQLTPFAFTISERADMSRKLDATLLDLMRSGQPVRPGDYSSDDLRDWDQARTLKENVERHHRLEELGIADAQPAPQYQDVIVSTYGEAFGGWAPAGGLENVARSNLAKLFELGPSYETHLAIGIGKYRVSQSADSTRVPRFPVGLDRLWLMHLWTDKGAMQVWSVGSTEARWRVHTPYQTA